jgi:hypothetical protein
MTTIVKMSDQSTRRACYFNPDQVMLFQKELARVSPSAVPVESNLVGVASDAEIVVHEDGQTTGEYELYARAVLVDTRTRQMMQFYMGLLLLEWLDK